MAVEVRQRDFIGGMIILVLLLWILLSLPASPLSPAIAISNPPPGTGSGGITDPNKLISAHRDVLEDEDYRLRLKHGIGREKKIIIRSDHSQMIVEKESGGRRVSSYAVDGRLYSRISYQGKVRRFRYEKYTFKYKHQNPLQFTEYLTKVVQKFDFRPVRITEKKGKRRVKFELVGGEYANGYLIVREDGLIQKADLSTRQSSIRMEFNTSSGVNINQPTWIDRARKSERDDTYTGESDSCTDAEDGDDDGWCLDELF